MDKAKAGIKTTEFWVGLVTAILIYLNSALDLKIPVDSIIAIVSVVITYIISRGIAKKGKP